MRFKKIIFLGILFFLYSCTIKNISKIDVPRLVLSLDKDVNLFSFLNKNSIIQQILYKDRYGRIIQKYRSYYGYWYRIRRGDSLYRIARRSGLSIRRLARANRLSTKTKLRWKDYLFIPVSKRYIEKYTEKIVVRFKTGRFIWPLWGRISSKFGLRHKRLHKGIDIAAPLGTKIMASADGKVIFSGRRRRYGYVIIINHSDNFQTRYAHLSRPLIRTGEIVKKGQVIGMVGKTGRATGYHLHFEIRIMGEPVDPLLFLPEKPNKLAEIYLQEGTRGLRP